MTFLFPNVRGHDSPLKESRFHHPKKVTKNIARYQLVIHLPTKATCFDEAWNGNQWFGEALIVFYFIFLIECWRNSLICRKTCYWKRRQNHHHKLGSVGGPNENPSTRHAAFDHQGKWLSWTMTFPLFRNLTRFFRVTQNWGFYSWPFQGLLVTSIWVIKTSLGRSWKILFFSLLVGV